MILKIKNKLSFGGDSKVTDEAGNEVFQVKGKVVTLRNQKIICDKDGKELYQVKNRLFNLIFHSADLFDAQGNHLAKINRKIGLKQSYDVVGLGDEIKIEGTIIGWTFNVFKNGKIIGTVKRQLTLVFDEFTLTVNEESEAAFLVALVIALDNVSDKAEAS